MQTNTYYVCRCAQGTGNFFLGSSYLLLLFQLHTVSAEFPTVPKIFGLLASGVFTSRLDRSQPLFYFVPQEKGLIWRSPWEWKNMRDSIFHPENRNIWPEIGQNRWWHMLRSSLVATAAAYAHVKINRMPTSIIAILGLKTSQGGNLHEGNVILPFAFPTYPPQPIPPLPPHSCHI